MTSIPGDRGSHLFRHGVHSKYAMARRLFVEEVDASIFTRYLSVLLLMKTPDCFLDSWLCCSGGLTATTNSPSSTASRCQDVCGRRRSFNENKLTAATVDLDNVNGPNGSGVAGIFIDWMGKSYLFFEGCTLTLACFTFWPSRLLTAPHRVMLDRLFWPWIYLNMPRQGQNSNAFTDAVPESVWREAPVFRHDMTWLCWCLNTSRKMKDSSHVQLSNYVPLLNSHTAFGDFEDASFLFQSCAIGVSDEGNLLKGFQDKNIGDTGRSEVTWMQYHLGISRKHF